MPKTNERTLKMMNAYIDLHNEGHSVKEIAEMFNLTPFTVYAHLGEIAKKAGVSRESLLERVFVADHSGQNYTQVEPLDSKEFEKHFVNLIDGINGLKQAVSNAIAEIEISEKEVVQ